LELDDSLAEVHYFLAANQTWGKYDWENAGKSFERAIELNPNYPDARAFYSWYLFYMQRPEEAMAQIERALELDPFNAAFRSLYAFDLMYARRFDEAVEDLQETLRIAPTDDFALSAIRSAYHVNGMFEEAYEAWMRYYDVHDDSEAEQAFLRGYGEGGYSGALNSVAELMIERSKTTFVTPWRIATVFTRAGKNQEALDYLEKAFEAHDANMPSISVDPIFDNLRDEPRFNELLRQMNLPQAK
jgi:adenylate cyclase